VTEAEDTLLEYLAEADRLVVEQYPDAQFFEADNLNAGRPGSPWRFVFNDPSTSPNSTVIIERLERGFGEPREIPEPWVGDRVIKLPITLGLEDARGLCERGGCRGEVRAMVLRHPLYPGVNEPYYIFTMPGERRRCWVGVVSGEVKCTPMEAA
jgi:hypothetical protein